MAEHLTTGALADLLNERGSIRSTLEEYHPHDIAEAAAELDDAALWSLLQALGAPLHADVFSRLPLESQVRTAAQQSPEAIAGIFDAMPSDDRVDLLRQLEQQIRAQILEKMAPAERRDAEQLAAYPEGTAGSVMSSEFATLRSKMSVAEALARLRKIAADRETIYYNYVVDEAGKLSGIVSLRDLVMADPAALLADIMSSDIVTVAATEPAEKAAHMISEYDLLALPVVSAAGRLVGVVTVDDVIDVQTDEATEDFHKLGATGLGRISLIDAGVWTLYSRRIVWLIVLIFVNVLSGAGIALYQETVSALVSLVFFLPLIIGSGGNAGSQAATLVVRALAVGEVRAGDWLRMLAKEFTVALALGLTMAAGASLISAVRTPEIMLVVAATMVLVVLVGSLMGAVLPLLLTRLGLDPATASGPLITSLADIAGVLIYFSLASWLLGIGSVQAVAGG